MDRETTTPAWLEKADGSTVPVTGNLSFGRISGNEVVLPDDRVSRRHATIHVQGEAEFWLVDLGSRNGTYLNDRRVSQPARLRDRDEVRLGPFTFCFRQPGVEAGARTVLHTTQQTLVEVRTATCWLLVADVEGSTRASQSRSADELAAEMQQWFRLCRQAIEAAGGMMNKYLGDGFLAFGKTARTNPGALAGLVAKLRGLQRAGAPDFRFVLHQGEVLLGGGGSLGEESLSGPEVNFVFRMEKLAGYLGERCLLSETAAQLLRESLPSEAVGNHALAGFEGRFEFFTCPVALPDT
jgi:class 3 adenylate cyclase